MSLTRFFTLLDHYSKLLTFHSPFFIYFGQEILPKTCMHFLICSSFVLGSLVTVITALPYILITMPPLIWYFVKTRNLFVSSSREIKRFEGLARSPIFAMLSESISGVSTIRTNDATQYMRRKFEIFHNSHSRATFYFVATGRWVAFRMDSLMFITVSCSCLLAAVFSDRGMFIILCIL
jgi:ATP-binding cassette subfamily C (CFTR/MRP) protein 4